MQQLRAYSFNRNERKVSRLLSLGVALVAVLLVAALTSPSAGAWADAEEAVPLVEAQWESVGIDDYEMVVARACECLISAVAPPPFRVTVIDGEITDVVSVATGQPGSWGLTIDDLFGYVVEVREGVRDAASVNVTTDAVYGYPSEIFIDYSAMIADEEFIVRISEFQPIADCNGAWTPAELNDADLLVPVTCAGPQVAQQLGDVNCDARSNIVDALLIARYSTGQLAVGDPCGVDLAAIAAPYGDVNADDRTDIVDALIIARCAAGIDGTFCAAMLDE